ncbi:MAG: PspC domain-containing protein [Bacteroidales bacterium]|nr:PspC domain-containing protein [Bacteroidales bacterium]
MADEIRRLYRNPHDKRIAGVCSGIAEYLNVDVTVVRILFLIALICAGGGFWIYLIVWLLAPEKA